MLPYLFHTQKKHDPRERNKHVYVYKKKERKNMKAKDKKGKQKSMYIVQQRPHRNNMKILSLLIIPMVYFVIGMYQQCNWPCVLYVFTIDTREIYSAVKMFIYIYFNL